MDMRKILSIFLIILLVVIAYNFLLVPLFMPNYGGMGMGMHGEMHWGMRPNMYGYNSYFYMQLFVVALVVLAILVLLGLYFSNNSSAKKKCMKCGYDIESEKWKVCPRCGSAIVSGKDDNR